MINLSLLVACMAGFVCSFILSKYFAMHNVVTDRPGEEPQKIHPVKASRMGGMAVLAGIVVSAVILCFQELALLLLASLPTYFAAFFEDMFGRIRASLRLVIAFCSSAIFIFFFNTYIGYIDIPLIDRVLALPIVGVAFTIFAVSGITNAFNIIDGLHGLASAHAIIIFFFYALTAFILSDQLVFRISILVISALLGFIIHNYPKGKILLGDNGAYFIGFMVATTSILLVYRNEGLSPWYPLLSVAYPFTETVFSMYRRKFRRRKAPLIQADFLHMHSLIFKRYIRENSRASMIFLISSLAIAFLAFLFKKSTLALILLYMMYFVLYTYCYLRVVRFKNGRIMALTKP